MKRFAPNPTIGPPRRGASISKSPGHMLPSLTHLQRTHLLSIPYHSATPCILGGHSILYSPPPSSSSNSCSRQSEVVFFSMYTFSCESIKFGSNPCCSSSCSGEDGLASMGGGRCCCKQVLLLIGIPTHSIYKKICFLSMVVLNTHEIFVQNDRSRSRYLPPCPSWRIYFWVPFSSSQVLLTMLVKSLSSSLCSHHSRMCVVCL